MYCLDCTLKHMGSALVLIDEYNVGYQASGLLAIGHLHELARECGDDAVSRRVRAMRKELTEAVIEGSPYDCSLAELLPDVLTS